MLDHRTDTASQGGEATERPRRPWKRPEVIVSTAVLKDTESHHNVGGDSGYS